MKMPIRLILLVTIVAMAIELVVIARWQLGVFDPRCLILRGYTVAHAYEKGQETIRCVPDRP